MRDLEHDLARLAPDVDDDAALARFRRRRRRARATRWGLSAAAVAVLAGVMVVALVDRSEDQGPRDGDGAVATSPTDGRPRVWAPSSPDGDPSGSGVLGVVYYRPGDGCFLLGPLEGSGDVRPIVWPAGAEGTWIDVDGGERKAAVALPDGTVVPEGSRIRAGGGVVAAPAYGIPPACLPPDGRAAVLDPTAVVVVDVGLDDEVWRSRDGEGTKDLVERVMADVLGDPSTALSGSDAGSGVSELTLQTSTRATVVAEVATDPDGRRRLVRLASPGLAVEPADGRHRIVVPQPGALTVIGYSGSLEGPGEVMLDAVDVLAPGPTEPFELVESAWLRIDLTTTDGQVLHYLAPR